METRRLVDLPPRGIEEAPSAVSPLRRLRWTWLIWLAAPVVIYLTLRTIPLQSLGEVFSRVKLWQIAALLGANLLIFGLFVLRWSRILSALEVRIPFMALVGYRLAGFGVSYFTPGPQFGGEPLQIYLLKRRQGVNTAAAISSVFFDKLLELLANFTFLVVGLVVAALGGVLRGQVGPWVWAAVGVIFIFPVGNLIALSRGLRPLTWLIERLRGWLRLRLLDKAAEHVGQAEGLIAEFCQTQPWALAQVLVISVLVWLASVAEFWMMLNFLGAPANLVETISMLVAARLAFLLPIPAGLGTLEASQILAVQAVGFAPAVGVAASLVIRARDVTLAALGLWIGGWNTR